MATLVLDGPPGVGKTETALVLAETLVGSRAALQRVDCAELKERHHLSRLLGAPPGYVGYEEGGALAEALAADAAVILFDEFDQAEGLNTLLLGILDAGRLTEGSGRTLTFENSVLIFSTNRGYARAGWEFSPGVELPDRDTFVTKNERMLEEWIVKGDEKHPGSPALWSRLQSAVIGYDLLRPEAVEKIVRLSCERLERNLGDEYGVRIELEAGAFAAAVAGNEALRTDGRALFRQVLDRIETPIRDALRGQSRDGGPPAGAMFRFAPEAASGRAAIAA